MLECILVGDYESHGGVTSIEWKVVRWSAYIISSTNQQKEQSHGQSDRVQYSNPTISINAVLVVGEHHHHHPSISKHPYSYRHSIQWHSPGVTSSHTIATRESQHEQSVAHSKKTNVSKRRKGMHQW